MVALDAVEDGNGMMVSDEVIMSFRFLVAFVSFVPFCCFVSVISGDDERTGDRENVEVKMFTSASTLLSTGVVDTASGALGLRENKQKVKE